MGKVCVECKKIKTLGEISEAYVHNNRIRCCENADPARSKDNIVVIDHGTDYLDYAKNRFAELDQYRKTRGYPALRKDAVIALDVVIGTSKEELQNNPFFSPEAFAKKGAEWLTSTFGEKNVIGAILHLDEHGPHIHATVIPVNDKGLLCARYFMRKDTLSDLQTSIGIAMKDLGLSRGQRKSVAKHTEIKKFYSDLQEATDFRIPPRAKDESVSIYSERIKRIAERSMHQLYAKNLDYENQVGQLKGRILELEEYVKIARDEARQLDQIGEVLDGHYLSKEDDEALRNLLSKVYYIIQKENITGEMMYPDAAQPCHTIN